MLYLWCDIDSHKGQSEVGSTNPPTLLELLVRYASAFSPYCKMHEAMSKQAEARAAMELGADPGSELVGFGKYTTLSFKMSNSTYKEHCTYCSWVMHKQDIRKDTAMFRFKRDPERNPPTVSKKC